MSTENKLLKWIDEQNVFNYADSELTEIGKARKETFKEVKTYLQSLPPNSIKEEEQKQDANSEEADKIKKVIEWCDAKALDKSTNSAEGLRILREMKTFLQTLK